jgi:hypothetical protein
MLGNTGSGRVARCATGAEACAAPKRELFQYSKIPSFHPVHRIVKVDIFSRIFNPSFLLPFLNEPRYTINRLRESDP